MKKRYIVYAFLLGSLFMTAVLHAGITGKISGEVIDQENQDMLVGEGYWIYMQNDCTLAGFTITPIQPSLD